MDVSGSRTRASRSTLDSGAGDLTTSAAQVNANALTLRSGQTLNNDGGTLSADAITLSAQHLSNRKGKLVQTGDGALAVKLPGNIDNREGRLPPMAIFSSPRSLLITRAGKCWRRNTAA
jgi:filamentous hemagglutinin